MAHAAAHLKKSRELEQCSEYRALQKAREKRRRQRERAQRKQQVKPSYDKLLLSHVCSVTTLISATHGLKCVGVRTFCVTVS